MKIATGIALLVISIWALFAVETRVDVAKLASSAVEISSDSPNPDPSLEGKLVSVTGAIMSGKVLGDGIFLKKGNYIALQRTVEMFSWSEKKAKKVDKKGAVYFKKWESDPPSALKFKVPSGHENPKKALESEVFKVADAKVGRYEIDLAMLGLPPLKELKLNKQKIIPDKKAELAGTSYLFAGKGKISSPEVSDLRISYAVLPMGETVTVFGKLSNNMIAPYLDQKNYRLYRLFYGARESAIASLPAEQKASVWLMRIIAILLFGEGVNLIWQEVRTLLRKRKWK